MERILPYSLGLGYPPMFSLLKDFFYSNVATIGLWGFFFLTFHFIFGLNPNDQVQKPPRATIGYFSHWIIEKFSCISKISLS